MNKAEFLEFTRLYQQMLMDHDEYERKIDSLTKENELLREDLASVQRELESLQKMLYSYGGKNA